MSVNASDTANSIDSTDLECRMPFADHLIPQELFQNPYGDKLGVWRRTMFDPGSTLIGYQQLGAGLAQGPQFYYINPPLTTEVRPQVIHVVVGNDPTLSTTPWFMTMPRHARVSVLASLMEPMPTFTSSDSPSLVAMSGARLVMGPIWSTTFDPLPVPEELNVEAEYDFEPDTTQVMTLDAIGQVWAMASNEVEEIDELEPFDPDAFPLR